MAGEGTAAHAPLPLRLRVKRAGREGVIAETARAVADDITGKLAQLNREIPVIPRISSGVDFEIRRRWNHFWLVDPLDGDAAVGADAGDFSINIALIEDRRPVAGVVYAVRSAIAWSTMVRKAFTATMAAARRSVSIGRATVRWAILAPNTRIRL